MNEDGSVPRSATRRRRDRVLEAIRSGGWNIDELAARFEVSTSTVRRDLAVLAREGRVMRTYGGAVEHGRGQEPSLRAKERKHWAEKDAIARAAAEMVGRGDVVLLDAGTTVGRLAWHLRQRDDITVVTNGLSALLALHDAPRVEVILLGGRLRRPNEAFLGTELDQALRRYRPDLAFLGADGLRVDRGVNCPSPEQAATKTLMAETSRTTWVLADHWKLDAEPYPYWAPLAGTIGLVTDDGCPEEIVSRFGAGGWVVQLAHEAQRPDLAAAAD